MSVGKAISIGLLAGLVAAIAMTTMMLVLACLGVATPLSIIGDRISVFIAPEPFLAIMGRVGGYNHLKELGIGSTAAGQLFVGALGGAALGLFVRGRPDRFATVVTITVFVLLPSIVVPVALWPVLGTNYSGLPINAARVVTLVGFALCAFVYERTLVSGFRYLAEPEGAAPDYSPVLARRAFVLAGIGLLISGGAGAIVRKLYRVATFSYDGTQYKGQAVQAITPNDLFYCVTKNIIDPRVDASLWHLEVNGLVQTPRTYRLEDIKAMPSVDQEATLMCISNGLDAGLMSNAMWKGVAMRDLLEPSAPLASAQRIRLHGVDNYTDTFPFEKAMDAATLLVYQMNGETLPYRHGYPARAIVPGYFGEKHVKWLTRIEVTTADAKGFYETQGWGPDFIVPTRSRIDAPDHNSVFSLAKLNGVIWVKGVAFGGDRGVSKVEVSVDDGENWSPAKIDYPGTKLTWALWTFDWTPQNPDNYTLVARATDGEGDVQEWDADRPFKSGVTGFHKIVVYVTA